MEKNILKSSSFGSDKSPSASLTLSQNSNANLNAIPNTNSINSTIPENIDDNIDTDINIDIVDKNIESTEFTFENPATEGNWDFLHTKKKTKRKIHEEIEPSSDSAIPSDIEELLQKKSQEKDEKEIKIRKIKQAKELLVQIMDFENSKDLQAEILEGINKIEFIHQKILNPRIQSPKETALKLIEARITDMDRKLENIHIGKPTYADIINSNQSKPIPQSPLVVIPKLKITTSLQDSTHNSENQMTKTIKTSKKEGIRPRRLILQVPKSFLDNLDSFKLRNEINKAFHLGPTPVVASISKSQSNQSLVITTMEDYSAKYLVDNKTLWESKIPFTKTIYDTEWAKLLVHTVVVEPFHKDLSLLKEEIETFNPQIKLMKDPVWMSKEENRINKKHSSILIHVESQDIANLALQSRLFIAGNSCIVERFIPKSTQCEKCQKFGHTRMRCKSLHPICQICSKNHQTQEHKCEICEISGKECPHIPALCANCQLSHKANDKKCAEWNKVKPKPKSRDISKNISNTSRDIPENTPNTQNPAETGKMDLE